MTELFLLCLVFLAAGVVQGATGFGFGLTALALLAVFWDLRDAAVLTAIGSLSLSLSIFWRLRAHFRRARTVPIIAATALAIPFGVWVLKGAPGSGLNLGLGALLVFTAAHNLIPRLATQPWHAVWTGVPCGILSGVLGGAFGTGGPPAVAYLASQGFDRRRYVVSLQLLFIIGGTVRIGSLVAGDLLTPPLAGISLLGAAFAVLGAWLGGQILARLSDRALRRLVAVLLLFLGVKYLWQA